MHNGKYHTEQYKQLQAEKIDRKFGPKISHEKTCELCGNKFIYKGRLNTKSYQEARFCSRKCANNRQSWWNDNARHYKTIALHHHAHKCAICGFDKVVAIHHIDENRKNNDPKNLIPLCPNHHEMYHSKWRPEVESYILAYQYDFVRTIMGD